MASSSGIIAIVAALVTVLMLSYGSYWAFEIRRALAKRLYRNQALGIGLLAISVGVAQFVYTGSTFYGWAPELSFMSIVFFSLSLWYWTNTSVGAARRSDPLLRDTFAWSRVRILILVGIVAAVIYDSANIIYNILNGDAISGTATGFLVITFAIPSLLSVIAAALIIPVAGFRSRDPALRKHLLWFGLFAVFLLVFIEVLSGIFTDPLQSILVQDLGILLGGYCIYKSAKSLVPLNRIAMEEPKTETKNI